MSKAKKSNIMSKSELPIGRTARVLEALSTGTIPASILRTPNAGKSAGTTPVQRLHKQYQLLAVKDENLRRRLDRAKERLAGELSPLLDPEIVRPNSGGSYAHNHGYCLSETGHWIYQADYLHDIASKDDPDLDLEIEQIFARLTDEDHRTMPRDKLSALAVRRRDLQSARLEIEFKKTAVRLAPIAERYWKAHDETVKRLGFAALDAQIEAVGEQLMATEDAILGEPPISVGDFAIKGPYVLAAYHQGACPAIEQHLNEVQAYMEKQAAVAAAA